MNETVTITQSEYQELLTDQNFLRCLEYAGVDNWEGYSFAQEEYDKHHNKSNEHTN